MPVTRISCSVLCSVNSGASRWIDHCSSASANREAGTVWVGCNKIINDHSSTWLALLTDGALLVHGLANHVDDTAQGAVANRHLRRGQQGLDM